jgi:DNA-binding response OmpR family regulator
LAGTDLEFRAVPDASNLDLLTTPVPPDVVLLDIALIGQDGLEVCRQLRADPRFLEIPVLLLSGQTDAETKRAGFAAGADDFVAKPFVPDELVARIQAQLRRRARACARNPPPRRHTQASKQPGLARCATSRDSSTSRHL